VVSGINHIKAVSEQTKIESHENMMWFMNVYSSVKVIFIFFLELFCFI
jgi:hypothetical protein